MPSNRLVEDFVPNLQDEERRRRFRFNFLPKTRENAREIISNIELCAIICLEREPRTIKELANTISEWRQREDVGPTTYHESIRSSSAFAVTNGMVTLTRLGRQTAYVALRKLELVGWIAR